MKANEKSAHLNTPQVYRTKVLVETLRKFESLDGKVLISIICPKDSKKITIRTLQRDIKNLKEKFGIVITNNNSLYSLENDKPEYVDSFLSHLEILSTAKLITADYNENYNSLSYIEFENESNANLVPNFKVLLEAIHETLPISFNHYSFYHLKEEKYSLKPYFLKQYQNRWYVIGETEKGYRTFGIDRLNDIRIGKRKFKSKTEEAKNKFKNVIGLNYVDHKLEKIHLSFHFSQKPYLLSLPLHWSQKQINIKNDTSFDIELLIHPNFEFRQQVLKYGSLVKLIEPKWLAKEIKEELRKGFEAY